MGCGPGIHAGPGGAGQQDQLFAGQVPSHQPSPSRPSRGGLLGLLQRHQTDLVLALLPLVFYLWGQLMKRWIKAA